MKPQSLKLFPSEHKKIQEMKIWQVQRDRVECGNLGEGFATESSTAPAFISQQVEESTVEKCKLVL